ncbi:hypothetical protein POTOM_054053 [Populus tomentosa]|uniref:Uncharacterized protein n=1 Tax=Populus tomentosa TaxID=118781 RepID=A0A8X8C6N4_POPTO|nr:hypothetical protein POTOM_054053 [Populus tomentosa]
MCGMREQFSDSLSHDKPLSIEMVSYLVDNKAEREQVSIPSRSTMTWTRALSLLTRSGVRPLSLSAAGRLGSTCHPHTEVASDEDENKLPYQSPKWIPPKSHDKSHKRKLRVYKTVKSI